MNGFEQVFGGRSLHVTGELGLGPLSWGSGIHVVGVGDRVPCVLPNGNPSLMD